MTDRRALFAGLATIAVANLFALGGVMYNRSYADSELALTEHEFRLTASIPREETSELKMRLQWCAEPDPGDSTDAGTGRFSIYECARTPRWLDRAKLESLGFDVPRTQTPVDYSNLWRRERRVLVVLELDGPTRQRMINLSRQALAARRADLSRWPDSASIEGNVIARMNAVAWLENGASRLFAVDAGLDRDELRARYPDRRRYAIVPAWVSSNVRTFWRGKPVPPSDTVIMEGHIDRLVGDEMNVAASFRSNIQNNVVSAYARNFPAPAVLDIRIAYGRKLEPWISSVWRR